MTLEKIQELDEKYYMNTFGKRTPVSFEKGKGIYLYDRKGNKYMDFFAGIAVSILGHSHPKVVFAICDQAKKFIHCSNIYYIEKQALLAQLICEISLAERVFFASTGAEANEGALKLARAYFKKKGQPQKNEFICLDKSFHGRTITTATATGQDKYKEPYAPLTPGFKHVPINDIVALENAIDDKTCGVFLEPIQGESGVYPLTKEYVDFVNRICKEKGIFLIVDEVQTGIARTGNMFGYETVGLDPDIFTLAKALGGGFPISALCAKEEAAKGFEPGDHGTTFGGNPLACNVAFSVLSTVVEEDLSCHAREMGDYFYEKLMAMESDKIKEVRYRGLMMAIEFKDDIGQSVRANLFEKGILVGSVGDKILRVLPPLIIEKEDIDKFVEKLQDIL